MAMTAICLPNFLIARKFQLLLPQANIWVNRIQKLGGCVFLLTLDLSKGDPCGLFKVI